MITPSFSLTATEYVLPKLALDFTTASLDSRITFTRTTDATHPATYINSSGYITAATDNQARFDYNTVSLTCNGLLIEESRSNGIIYSSDVNDANWTKSGVTTAAPSITSPDNATNGVKVTESNVSEIHYFRPAQRTGLSTGTDYTYSIFLKADGRRYVSLTGYAAPGTYAAAVFDLQDGVVTATGALNYTLTASNITAFRDNWFRCAITFRLNTGAASYVAVGLSDVSTLSSGNYGLNTYLGDGTSSVYAFGGQFETGAFATSYIPTTSTALTRNADIASMTSTNFSSWYNATEGTFNVTCAATSNTAGQQVIVTDGTAQNQIGIGKDTATNSSLFIRAANVNQVNISKTGVLKNCGAYKLNNCGYSSGGASTTTDLTATMPVVDQLYIGRYVGDTAFYNGCFQKINYWPQRLTNAEVQAFSK